jgi:hypothetical protein
MWFTEPHMLAAGFGANGGDAVSRIVWRAALVGVAVWSVVAFIAYSVVDMVGSGASTYGTVPGFPAEPFTFAWIAAKAHGLGLSAVAAGWLVGAAMILGGAALFQRFFGRPTGALPKPRSFGSSIPSGTFTGTRRPGLFARLLGR